MDQKLPSKPHSIIRVNILGCRFSVSTFWEKVWGRPEYYTKISCNIADGPCEFVTKMFARQKDFHLNESFTFVLSKVLDPDEVKSDPIIIKITLFKAGFQSGEQTISLTSFKPDQIHKSSLKFDSESVRMQVEVSCSKEAPLDFRFSRDIPEIETTILNRRKENILQKMQNIVKEDARPSNEDEVPTISVLCSGGGVRAAVQFCGAMEALQETGILDSVSYLSGLSGGAWYLFTAYSKQALSSQEDLLRMHTGVKATTKSSILSTFVNLSNYWKYTKYKRTKELEGQPANFTDFYGFTLGRSFLHHADENVKLSELRPYIETGEVPIPLVKAIHARSKVSTSEYHADLELTPWEISMPNYGINMKVEDFGSEWYNGNIVRSCPEHPLHFFYGATSSAFGLLLKYFLDGETVEEDPQFIKGVRKHEFGNRKTKRKKRKGSTTTRKRRSRRSTYSTSTISEGDYHSVPGEAMGTSWRIRSQRKKDKEKNEEGRKGSEDIWYDAIPPTSPIATEETGEDALARSLALYRAEGITKADRTFPKTTTYRKSYKKKSPEEHNGQRRASIAKSIGMSLKEAKQEKRNEACLEKLLRNMSHHPLFTDREAVLDRTAKVLNFSRGLTESTYSHMNPEHPVPECVKSGHLTLPTDDDIISFVDSAVITNVPTNSVLRSGRRSDILIVCDASEYKSDTHIDYLQLFIAEKLAKQQGLKFPYIDPQILKDDPRGVGHIFTDDKDPECPTVIWFTLSTRDFKRQENVTRPELRPGEEPYKLPKGEVFNDFQMYGPTYTTFRAGYTPLEFDRLRELMKFNVKSRADAIKKEIERKIIQKKDMNPKEVE